MPISRGQEPRQLYRGGGIMNLAPRQQYGLGSLVKSVKKAVSGAVKGVKSFAKSDIGKMALLLGGGYLAGGGGMPSFLGGRGLGGFQFGNLPGASLFSKSSALGGPKYNLGGFGAIGADKGMSGLTKGLLTGGALSSIFASQGISDEQAEEIKQNPAALRGYLTQYYKNLNQDAEPEEVNQFVETNMAEYKSNGGRIGAMYGGRIGYQIGGDVAYDATDSIYGSSAATFTPDTVMDAFGNQVQAQMGKYIPPTEKESLTAGPVFPTAFTSGTSAVDDRGISIMPSMPSKIPGGITDIPASGGLKATDIDMPIAGGNNNQMGILPVMPQLPGFSDDSNSKLDVPQGGMNFTERSLPQEYNEPLPKDQLMSGFEQYKKNNPVGGGTQALVPVTLPNGENFTFTNGGDAAAFAQYLQSIGQAPYQKAAPRIGQLKFANGGRIGAMYGGRMKLEDGTLDPRIREIVMDLMDNEGFEFGEAVKEAYKRVEQRANGGRIGYAFGSDAIVDQASGIMGLPKRTNNAGVKELDLRDSGGFIPPVGVKEKADDVPAMLSNNEFVFTADAVREFGDGNVNKGAQRMYDMMKKLEKGGRV